MKGPAQAAMRAKLAAAGFAETRQFKRVDAVDGATLDVASARVAGVFNLTRWRYGGAKNCHQDHGYRPRVVGCAMSHLAAWEAVAADADDPHALHLVLEDDVEFSPDFAARRAGTKRRGAFKAQGLLCET